jgi:hypothetical protein
MIRIAGMAVLTLAVGMVLVRAADDPAPGNLKPPNKEKGGLKDEAAPRPDGGASDEQTKELLARVAKNMGISEDRLKNRDPGTKTRQVQEQIINDLDELIKKSQDEQNQCANCKSSSGQASSSGQSSASKSASNRSNKSSRGQRSQSQQSQGNQGQQAKNNGDQQPKEGSGQKKKGGEGYRDPAASAKDGQGKDKQGQGNQGKDATTNKNGGGGAVGASRTDKKNTIADLFRDVWGHLPETKRQEMDAYSRERFMPKYDELLRQYYRTLSEQGRKKESE